MKMKQAMNPTCINSNSDLLFNNMTIFVKSVEACPAGYRYTVVGKHGEFIAETNRRVIGDMFINHAGSFISISGSWYEGEHGQRCKFNINKIIRHPSLPQKLLANLSVCRGLSGQITSKALPYSIDIDRLMDDIAQAKAVLYMTMMNFEPDTSASYNNEILHDALTAATSFLTDGIQVCDNAKRLEFTMN